MKKASESNSLWRNAGPHQNRVSQPTVILAPSARRKQGQNDVPQLPKPDGQSRILWSEARAAIGGNTMTKYEQGAEKRHVCDGGLLLPQLRFA